MSIHPKETGDRLQFRSPVDAAGFTQASNCVLLDKEISDGAKVTYLLLRKHAWQDPSCFPGQKRLCDERGSKNVRCATTWPSWKPAD